LPSPSSSPVALIAATIALFVGIAITLAALTIALFVNRCPPTNALFGAVADAVAHLQPFSSSPSLLPPLHSLSPATLVAVAITRLIVVSL
jgi:hypothetical protein